MAEEKIDIHFGANTGELKSGMSEAESTVNTSTTQMKAGLEAMAELTKAATKGIKGAIESCLDLVSTAFPEAKIAIEGIKIAMEAAIQVWEGIKKAIANTVSWNMESMKMASTLGVTNQAASGLAVTLNHIGISQETFSKATNAMTGQLKSNEQAFKDLDIKTRDANGNYRSMTDIMLDTNKALAEITAGTEREVAGKKIYGDAWNEVRDIINLTSAEMVLGQEKAHDLGLEVSEYGAQSTKKYTMEMRDMNAGMTAFSKVVGDATMPLLGKLAEYFNNVLPAAVTIFKVVVNSVVEILDTVGVAVNGFWVLCKATFLSVAVAIWDTAVALKKFVTGDFAGAAASMKDIGRDIAMSWKMSLEEINKDNADWAHRMQNLFGLGPKTTAKTPEGKHLKHGDNGKAGHDNKAEHGGSTKEYHSDAKRGKGGKGGGGAEKNRISEWKSGLENWKEDQGNYFRDYTKVELKYWQDALKLTRDGSNEQRQVRHEISQLNSKIAHEDLATQLQALKEESDNALKGSQQRIDIAKRKATLIKDAHREETKEYKAVLEEIRKLEKERDAEDAKRKSMVAEKKRELASIEISAERDKISALKSLGEISAREEIERLKKLEEQEFALQRAALEEEIALKRQGSEEETKAITNLELAEAKHLKSMEKMNLQAATENKRQWTSVFSSIGDSFSNSIKGMVSGTMTFRKAMQQLVKGVLDSFISMGLKMVTDWIQKEVLMTAITKMYTAVRTALFGEAATTTAAAATTSANAQITSTAPAAAAGAASSQASIPYVGPILAAAAMASMLSMVLGLKSAAGGYEIPAGINPMTQLHSDEMVLPADLSSGLKNIIRSGQTGDGMGGSNGTHVHMHVSTLDAKGVKSFMKANKAAVASAAIAHVRNLGSLTPARGTR